MKQNVFLLIFSTLIAIGILFIDIVIGKMPYYTQAFSSPWLFATEAFVFAAAVSYFSQSRGWLMGMLAIASIFITIFLLATIFASYSAIQISMSGQSIIDIIKLNISAAGLESGTNTFMRSVLLPSLTIGAVGGMLGSWLRKS